MSATSSKRLAIVGGTANAPLAESIAGNLGVGPLPRDVGCFSDGEFRIELLASVRGADVYIVQPTGPPVADNLLELLLLADACRRAGAARLTAIVPYFGYARQDRRIGRQPVSARLIADIIGVSGVDRVVVVDLHTTAVEGFFGVPVEHLTALPFLADSAADWLPPDPVVVAPDLGAAKLAERYAGALDLPFAVLHKRRTGESVGVRALSGEVRDHGPVIVDDMISTGATIEAALRVLLDSGSLPDALVVATHGLLVGSAAARLRAMPIRRLLVTDSVLVPSGSGLPLQTVTLAPLLAETVRRLHRDRSLGDLLVHAS